MKKYDKDLILNVVVIVAIALALRVIIKMLGDLLTLVL